ncbi:adhesion G protein-coupled receptor L3-like isoform X1 [Asterias rubens]|uniref:adhesion G protein-coupled receptor L3-like isoform X1 n=1 Tax=Asterias rubens TaxID=7604 RepID=UPI001455964C|nr:adhesion G protein-coupled receptor L3-like isoform X1 [Asterias rubens]
MIVIKPVWFIALLQTVHQATCQQCQQETVGDLTWPKASGGENVTVQCGGTGEGEAIRLCKSSGIWHSDINYTGCTSQVLEDLYIRTWNASSNVTTLEEISRELEVETNGGGNFYSGQLAQCVQILQVILNAGALNTLSGTVDTTVADSLIKNVLDAADNLLNAELFASMWSNIHQYKDGELFLTFLQDLEGFGENVTSYLIRVNHQPLKLSFMQTTHFKSIYEVLLDTSIDVSHGFPSPFTTNVTIPRSVLPSSPSDPAKNISIATLVFASTVRELFPNQTHNSRILVDDRNISSLFVSCNIYPQPTTPFQDFVEIRTPNKNVLPNSTCSYLQYNDTESVWKKDLKLCEKPVFHIEDNTVTCKCKHLTTFAVIGSYNTRGVLPNGILVSMVFYLVITAATFCLVLYANRNFDSDRASLVLCFLATLFTGHLTLVTGIYAIDNKDACRAVALLLYYFQLSYSFWMLAQSVQLVLKVTYKTVETGTVAQFCALGWITPLFVVASMAGLDLEPYGRGNHCAIPLSNGVIFALIVPITLIGCTNFVCLFYAFYCIYRLKKTDRKCLAQMNIILPNIRACLIIIPLEIIEWAFTSLSIDFEFTVFDVLWALSVVIMGIFVFLFYGIGSSEVVVEYEKHFGPCCWQHKKSSAVHDSPRPGWRDEISQISQFREASSIMRDMDSIATVTGNGAVAGCSGVNNGGLEPDDVLARGKELNEPTGLTSSSLTSSFMLKTKLKVFPLRKNNNDQPAKNHHQDNPR